jgi:hypothetical protein
MIAHRRQHLHQEIHATPFKVQVNFDIPLFEGLIDAVFLVSHTWIPFGIPLKNNTTLLEATRTSTPDGPPCIQKGTIKYHISQIFSIPCTPKWVSNTQSDIWYSNTAVICIDTFK